MKGSSSKKSNGIVLVLAVTMAIVLPGVLPAAAQSLFSPVAKVNDSVITAWEVDQRARFLALFRTPGDTREIAIERLIDERLQIDEARANDIEVTDEAIAAGMSEFAARANLTIDQFIVAIGQGGVTEEAFRDFVRAGIAWRELVRARFGPEARPSQDEIDARLLETGSEGGSRVLMHEIILPAGDPATLVASRARAAEIARITDEEEFKDAAQLFSQAPTRIRGGELDWLPVAGLPAPVQTAVSRLVPGRVSTPVELGNGIALFFLRDRDDVRSASPDDVAIEFVVLTMESADAATEAAGRVRTCNDLFGIAERLPEERLRRETLPAGQVPANIAAALENLDPGETALLPDSPSSLVMFCRRMLDTEVVLNRDAVAQELVGLRLTTRAARLLAEIRANATITRLE